MSNAPAGGDQAQVSLRTCPRCGHDMSGSEVLVCAACGAMIGPALLEAETAAGVAQSAAAAEGDAGAEGGGGAPATPSLGAHAARGFSFMLVQSLASRVIALGSQLALTYILAREHFGLLALADSIAVFANLLLLIGVREVLVSRPRTFHVWANAGFWIMATAGAAAGLLVAGAAPIAARAYHNPEITGLMLVIALSMPLSSLSIVGEAKLQAELRFKRLALILAVWASLLPTLTLAFALMGFGAYSFVIPRVIVAAVRLVMVARAARLPLRWNPQVRRWKYLVGTSMLVFVTSLLLLVSQIADRPILGAFVDDETLGLYAFAFAFSLQTIMMISVNLEGVLFATLAKLNDEPERQLRAFLRASRTLAAVVVPICLVQVAASDAAVGSVFDGEKWAGAVRPMQALGLGMLFLGSYCPATAMLQAQRRFGLRFRLAAAHAAVYLVAVVAGALIGRDMGGPDGVITGGAIGVAVTLAIISPVWSWCTTRSMGGTWATTLGIVARPLILGLIAAAVGLMAGELAARPLTGVELGPWRISPKRSFGPVDVAEWVRLAAIGAASVLVYVPLMRVFMPVEFNEIASKVLGPLRRFWPAGARAFSRLARVR